MRFLIVEDEPPAAERLSLLLKQQNHLLIDIPVCQTIEETVIWINHNQMPDCIFMDIHLSDGLSFNIADEVEINCPVIFTTAYDDYSLKAFEFYAIDYLLKPVTNSGLKQALSKLNHFADLNIFKQQKLNQQNKSNHKFMVKLGNKLFFLDANNISFFNADDKTVYINTIDGNRFIVDLTLDKIMEQLDETIFFRTNRNTITRYGAIKEIKSYPNRRLKLMVEKGTIFIDVIVSRDRVAAFKNWVKNSF